MIMPYDKKQQPLLPPIPPPIKKISCFQERWLNKDEFISVDKENHKRGYNTNYSGVFGKG